MDFLGWTIADPTNTKNLKDSKVYAINKKGESFTAETIDAAMRVIMERDIEIKIEMDAEVEGGVYRITQSKGVGY